MIFLNHTNKFFKLKRGEVVGKGGCLKEQDVKNFNVNELTVQDENNLLTDLNVSEEYRAQIAHL